MKIYELKSKNVLTLAISVALSIIGLIGALILSRTGNHFFDGMSGSNNPFVMGLFPVIFAGLPVLLVASFIYGLYSLGHEEKATSRYQVAGLLLIILIIGYLTSYLMFSMGGM